MNDPRVIAWQPAKFAARLQAENGSDKPFFLGSIMNPVMELEIQNRSDLNELLITQLCFVAIGSS